MTGELHTTQALRPRPVWARHLLRSLRNLEDLGPPSEEEKHDAIKVLRDPDNAGVPGLWIEAHRIFDEASVKGRRELLNDLTRFSEELPGGYR